MATLRNLAFRASKAVWAAACLQKHVCTLHEYSVWHQAGLSAPYRCALISTCSLCMALVMNGNTMYQNGNIRSTAHSLCIHTARVFAKHYHIECMLNANGDCRAKGTVVRNFKIILRKLHIRWKWQQIQLLVCTLHKPPGVLVGPSYYLLLYICLIVWLEHLTEVPLTSDKPPKTKLHMIPSQI